MYFYKVFNFFYLFPTSLRLGPRYLNHPSNHSNNQETINGTLIVSCFNWCSRARRPRPPALLLSSYQTNQFKTNKLKPIKSNQSSQTNQFEPKIQTNQLKPIKSNQSSQTNKLKPTIQTTQFKPLNSNHSIPTTQFHTNDFEHPYRTCQEHFWTPLSHFLPL